MENKELTMQIIKDLKSIKDKEGFINKCIEFVETEIENVYAYTKNKYYRPIIAITKEPVGNDRYNLMSNTLDYLDDDNILYKYIPKKNMLQKIKIIISLQNLH